MDQIGFAFVELFGHKLLKQEAAGSGKYGASRDWLWYSHCLFQIPSHYFYKFQDYQWNRSQRQQQDELAEWDIRGL